MTTPDLPTLVAWATNSRDRLKAAAAQHRAQGWRSNFAYAEQLDGHVAMWDAILTHLQAPAPTQGDARWKALKVELKHRYDTEHIPARKAEQDSILAEMYAIEMGAGKAAIKAPAGETARPTCLSCDHWTAISVNPATGDVERVVCCHPERVVTDMMPADGSGYCHLHPAIAPPQTPEGT
jgi:hypothetical protein